MESIFKYIVAIYRAGSLRAAADVLHVTQPALSISLSKYEEQIGAKIFDRRTHPFALTPAGEIILRNIEQIMLNERKMQTELNDLKEMNTGDIRIAATHYVNSVILPPVLNLYMQQFPKINVHLTEKGSHEVMEDFLVGMHDVGICASQYNVPDIGKISILRDRLIWAIPNRFLTRQITESFHVSPVSGGIHDLQSLELLEKIPFISLLPGDNLFRQAEDLFAQQNISPKTCVHVPQSTTAWHMCYAGIGAALIPESLIHIIPSPNTNVSLFHYDSPLMERTISVFFKKDNYLSTAVTAFLRICKKISVHEIGK